MDEHHEGGGTEPPRDIALRVKALESLLIDELVGTYETRVGPRNGAKAVARAWTDPTFKQLLLEDATDAFAALGITGPKNAHLVAAENSATVHNLVVCTLCSCYPWAVLGLPPTWYKSEPYRARAVREARAVLAEFGTHLPDDVEIRVWDSTSEMRYFVVPEQPPGTEGWSTDELEPLVTRNSMIGVEFARRPAEAQ